MTLLQYFSRSSRIFTSLCYGLIDFPSLKENEGNLLFLNALIIRNLTNTLWKKRETNIHKYIHYSSHDNRRHHWLLCDPLQTERSQRRHHEWNSCDRWFPHNLVDDFRRTKKFRSRIKKHFRWNFKCSSPCFKFWTSHMY